MRILKHFNVTINGEHGLDGFPERGYEDLVETELGKLYSAAVGRAIFTIIRAQGWVEIRPYAGTDCNAQSIGKGSLLVRAMMGFNGIVLPERLEFSPQQYAKGSTCSRTMPWDSDELLCHEIFHSARRLGGDDSDAELTGYMAEYEYEEEFFAILVANIYSSETGRPEHLRGGHLKGSGTIPKYLQDPEKWLGFKEVQYNLVDKFCRQHYVAAPMMAKAKADFNPLRIYYEWKAKGYKPDTWTINPY